MSKKEVIIIFILIIVAVVRFFFFIPKGPDYNDVVGQDVSLIGIVSEDPDIRLKTKHLNVKLKDKDVNILVFVGREVEVNYGDEIEVRGVLEEPENFTTNTGKEFNYKRYLANKDIYYLIKNAEIKIITRENGSKLKSLLYKIRASFMRNINNVIPSPESDLANGLILGARGGFDEDTKQEFIDTGTVHIIALSGYNVSIVAENVMKAFSLILSQTIAIILGVVVILLFIIMTGASATAIRAGIMATIMLLGRMTGRKYLAGRALVIAGFVMIAYDPRVIVDMSFQLSFIATWGVLFITPKTLKWFRFLPLRFGFREMVASTVAATIAVLPILLHLTGVFSLVSLPANFLILLLIPIAMLFIFITGISGFITPVLAVAFGYITYLILLYMLSVIHFFGSLSFSSVSIQSFPLVLTIVIYGFLLWWVHKDN
ncbi:MAG: internalization-related competence protein ComEC/Rec2 protein [Candidatus Nomurabacteria bacterium GW2011_GWF2_35_66]|uniref:Internalization-related competence protein ComEC/Rec2 protein n=1 Tax=Candidatus Nomurabacteria bacterium GW2011_GWE1_35_16 TaxID=1618761 RepID=A0A0G0BR26_9BACT|nr:MAG: internalization-related competence protein ComEC/Rec2 protein [Candidatus Nomurabacteria bacterium GW2011_GWF1_34_20]KKP62110.1 MAG: internalization-related competence protein ComEC/Rec2 protein [Candidatus Nomurabacteria bacterium GW2011_GWE2_34_25]KKP66076.1 MAG: internalization-related competence protein ComEC/Rec2 protein [Candidatus Nomurabacteria bacterium GW2011_GWE1_35_16]KKP83018.1 MAG: internalization-related competence protein ComEC/Rec2 protein [Candidatus Nomurabacteria bact